MKNIFLLATLLCLSACAQSIRQQAGSSVSSSRCSQASSTVAKQPTREPILATQTVVLSTTAESSSISNLPSDWNADLTEDQITVLRDGGTETPYTSPLLNEHRKGTFVSADCNEPVFRSEQKFDSGTGWPSFWAPISADAVIEKSDTTLGMTRTEVTCARCGSHLGHIFADAPQTPSGQRYCINSVSLKFIPAGGSKKSPAKDDEGAKPKTKDASPPADAGKSEPQ